MFQSSSTRIKNKIKNYFSNHFCDITFNTIMIFIYLITVVLYVFGLPIIQKDSTTQKEQYEQGKQIIIGTCFMGVILHITGTCMQNIDLRTGELERMKVNNEVIGPAGFRASIEFDEEESQSLDGVLGAHTAQDLAKQAFMDPQQFWQDYSDLVKLQLLQTLSPGLAAEEVESLKKFVNEGVVQTVERLLAQAEGGSQFLRFMQRSAPVLQHDMAFVAFQAHRSWATFDFHYFLTLNKPFYTRTREAILHTRKLTHTSHQLLSIPNKFDNEPDFYSQTFSSQTVYYIQSNGDYDSELDKVLLTWYYTQLSTSDIAPLPIKLSNQIHSKSNTPDQQPFKQPDTNTTELLGLLENELGISRQVPSKQQEGSQATTLRLDQKPKEGDEDGEHHITFQTFIQPDTSINNMLHKIDTASQQSLNKQVPHFYSIISDFKKIKLVFDNQEHLANQIHTLKNKFGDKFNERITLKEQNVMMRIAKMNNGFLGREDEMMVSDFRQSPEAEEEQKVVVQLEVYLRNQGYSLPLEVQCFTSAQVSFNDTETLIAAWEASELNYAKQSDQVYEAASLQVSINCSVTVWRILQGLLVCLLVPCLAQTALEVNGFLDLALEECFTVPKGYRRLIMFCLDNFEEMSSTQQFNFCSSQQELEAVSNKCTARPRLIYDMCMMQDTDTLTESCQTIWGQIAFAFLYDDQFNYCLKYHGYKPVSSICTRIPGVYLNLCMSQGPTLTLDCLDWFPNNFDTLSSYQQLDFCSKYSNLEEVTSLCNEKHYLFFKVCLQFSASSLPNQCSTFLIINFESWTELELQVMCNKQRTNLSVKESCDNAVYLKQHQCQRMVELDDDCLIWFENKHSLLTDAMQHTLCQTHLHNSDMARICIYLPVMFNQLYDICMLLDQDPIFKNCAFSLQTNQKIYSELEKADLCQKYNLMEEMNTFCWQNLEFPPMEFVQTPELDNVCFQSMVKVNCILSDNRLDLLNQELPIRDLEMNADNQLITKYDYSLIQSIDETVQGVQFQNSYGQFQSGIKFNDVQLTPTHIISSNQENSKFMSNGTDQNFNKQQDVHKRLLFANNQTTCAINAVGVLCDTTNNFYGDNDVPVELETETPLQGVGSGLGHFCVLTMARTVLCWGSNSQGQLNVPIALQATNSASFVFAAGYSACALDGGRRMECWGGNNYGGTDLTDFMRTAQVAHADGGANNTQCAVFDSTGSYSQGQTLCWGQSGFGITSVPVSFRQLSQVAVGTQQACGLDLSHKAGCWGESSEVPAPFFNVSLIQIRAGREKNCFVRESDNFAWCYDQWNGQSFGIEGQVTLDVECKANNFVLLSLSGGLDGYQFTPDFKVELKEDFTSAGTKFTIELEAQLVTQQQIGPSKEMCITQVNGTNACSGQVEEANLLTSISLGSQEQMQCMIEAHVCMVSANDPSVAVCVSPAAPAETVFSVSHPDLMLNAEMRQITDLQCGLTRVCVIFADESALCAGTEAQDNYQENNLTPEMSHGVMKIKVGHRFTCVIFRNQTLKCNGMFNNQSGQPISFSIHDDPIPTIF